MNQFTKINERSGSYQQQASLRKQLRCKLTDMKVQNDLIDRKLLSLSTRINSQKIFCKRVFNQKELKLQFQKMLKVKKGVPVRANNFKTQKKQCRDKSQNSLSMSRQVKLKTRFRPHKRRQSMTTQQKPETKKLIKKTIKNLEQMKSKKVFRRSRRTKSFVCTSLKELQQKASKQRDRRCNFRQTVKTEVSSVMENSIRTSQYTSETSYSQKIRDNSKKRVLLQRKVKDILSKKMEAVVSEKKTLCFQSEEEVINYAMNLVAQSTQKENICSNLARVQKQINCNKKTDENMIEDCLQLLKNDEVKKLQIISKMRNFQRRKTHQRKMSRYSQGQIIKQQTKKSKNECPTISTNVSVIQIR